MRRDKLKILIIGDRFVTTRIFKEALERHLVGMATEVSYETVETSWPDDPLHNVEEVREAVGDVDALIDRLSEIDVIVTDYGAVTKRMIDAADRLQLIAVARGGPVSVNAAAARERGIEIVHLPGRNSRAVAEFTLAFILCLLKKITECHVDMKRGIWRGDFYRFESAPRELPGMVAGLVGFGSVARLLTPMLHGLGMTVWAHDPWVEASAIEEHQARAVDFEALLAGADIVSLHARVTPENTGMMGEGQFRKMQRSSLFVNTARGELVNYAALYRALKESWIAGAAIDIFESEPMSRSDPLLELNNVIFTPHIAGSSRETAVRSADLLARKVAQFVEGRNAGGTPRRQ